MIIMSKYTRYSKNLSRSTSSTRLYPCSRARAVSHYFPILSPPGRPISFTRKWWTVVSSTWTATTSKITNFNSWARSACRCSKRKFSNRERLRSLRQFWTRLSVIEPAMLLTKRLSRSVSRFSSIWASLSQNQWKHAKEYSSGKATGISQFTMITSSETFWPPLKRSRNSLQCFGIQTGIAQSTSQRSKKCLKTKRQTLSIGCSPKPRPRCSKSSRWSWSQRWQKLSAQKIPAAFTCLSRRIWMNSSYSTTFLSVTRTRLASSFRRWTLISLIVAKK